MSNIGPLQPSRSTFPDVKSIRVSPSESIEDLQIGVISCGVRAMDAECCVAAQSSLSNQHETNRSGVATQPIRSESSISSHSDEDGEQQTETDFRHRHSFVESCKRPVKSLIHAVFNHNHSIFEVTRKCKNYLNIMGVPLKNGKHVLFPEEVLFLMESWNIYAVDEGRTLTLFDGVRILSRCGVPFHKYRAYSTLRKAGFVVLRPDRSRVQSLSLDQEEASDSTQPFDRACSSSRTPFPRHLLDNFPTIQNNKLIISQLHCNPQLTPVEDLVDLKVNPQSYRIRKPWRIYRQTLRPGYWPDFDDISISATSWMEFARGRRLALTEAKRTAHERRPYNKNLQSDYDFEVFLSDRYLHSLPTKPVFRVKCFDSRSGAMSCAYTHRLSDSIPLVLSIYDCGYICFVEISGESIDLNQYLKNLREDASNM